VEWRRENLNSVKKDKKEEEGIEKVRYLKKYIYIFYKFACSF